jgi:hypothetical protein
VGGFSGQWRTSRDVSQEYSEWPECWAEAIMVLGTLQRAMEKEIAWSSLNPTGAFTECSLFLAKSFHGGQ